MVNNPPRAPNSISSPYPTGLPLDLTACLPHGHGRPRTRPVGQPLHAVLASSTPRPPRLVGGRQATDRLTASARLHPMAPRRPLRLPPCSGRRPRAPPLPPASRTAFSTCLRGSAGSPTRRPHTHLLASRRGRGPALQLGDAQLAGVTLLRAGSRANELARAGKRAEPS